MLKGHNCGHVINSNKFRAEAHSAHTAHPVFAKRGSKYRPTTKLSLFDSSKMKACIEITK